MGIESTETSRDRTQPAPAPSVADHAAEATVRRWRILDTETGLYFTAARGGRAWSPEGTRHESRDEAVRALLKVGSDRFPHVVLVEEVAIIRAEGAAIDLVPPPKMYGVIPSSWLGIAKGGDWSARSHLETLRFVEHERIDPHDLPAVAKAYERATGRKASLPPRS